MILAISPWACSKSGSTRPWHSRRPSTKRRSRCGAASSPSPGSSTGHATSKSAPRPPRSSTKKTPSACSATAATRRQSTPSRSCSAMPWSTGPTSYLQSDRSVIRQLLARGFEVYLIDWGVPSAADRSMTLKDYIDGLMKNCADDVLKRHKVQSLHLVGYCMGGTMSTIFTARNPDIVKSLSIMAAPIDFGVGKEESLVTFWSNPDYFDIDALVDAFGNVPATFLQASFGMMKPVQNYYSKYITFFDKMDDDKFMENYFAMEKWGNDNIPVAGETFREFVKKFYQRNELIKGEYKMGDELVDLSKITCPLQILMASADHLVPPSQSESLKSKVGSKDVKCRTLDAGHIGLSVSSKAHKVFWPEVTQWLADRSGRVSH